MSWSRNAPPEDFTKERNCLHRFALQHGFEIEWRNQFHPEYQLARLTGDGFCIIAYPHKTKSTGNRHIRLRSQHSADEQKAQSVMDELKELFPFEITFQTKK